MMWSGATHLVENKKSDSSGKNRPQRCDLNKLVIKCPWFYHILRYIVAKLCSIVLHCSYNVAIVLHCSIICDKMRVRRPLVSQQQLHLTHDVSF